MGDGSEVNSKHILEKLGFVLIENKGDEFYKDNGYCNSCVNRNKTNCKSCKCEIWKLNRTLVNPTPERKDDGVRVPWGSAFDAEAIS